MKLLLCFAVTVLGTEHLVRRDVNEDEISIFDLMEEGGEDIGKWGNGPGTGIDAGGSDKCPTPLVMGGYWHCSFEEKKTNLGVAYQQTHGRKRREDEEDIGRWSTATQPSLTFMMKRCKLACEKPKFRPIGQTECVCNTSSGEWTCKPEAYCQENNPPPPPPPKQCKDLGAKVGTMICTGKSTKRQCTLKCPYGYKSSNGRFHFNCHYGHWDGTADCIKPMPAPNMCKVPLRKPGDKGCWICETGPCQPVANWGRKKRESEGLEGRWGQEQCLICHFKCDPIHMLKSGGRAQCRTSDGVWIEKAEPFCSFGHSCEWPSAGPMGYYECSDNLAELGYMGYSGLGHHSESDRDAGVDREVNFEEMEEVDDYEEVIFRKKRGAGKSKKQEVVGNDGIARWSPPPPPTLPTPQWWNARWTCNLRCAKFHKPRSGSYHATCKLDSSTWTSRPTECVYESPCRDPATPNGVFRCWEATIVNDKNKKNKGKYRRSSNETEADSFTPNPLGRWGAPTKPNKPKIPDFTVRKECVLSCNNCHSPTTIKSVCLDGNWQEGLKPGKCTNWQKCSDKPFWDPLHGFWTCTGGAGIKRTCKLNCFDYHVPRVIIPAIPPPDEATGCNAYTNIDNGWMECNMDVRPVECMIMCHKGHTPNSNTAYAQCSLGVFYPPMSGEFTWGCKPGKCDKDFWKESCWDKNYSGRKRRDAAIATLAERNVERSRRDTEETGIGRWGSPASPIATCNNCNGLWQNQVRCEFDSKCKTPPVIPGGGRAHCDRKMPDMDTDYHECDVYCPKNYKTTCHQLNGDIFARKKRETSSAGAVGRWGVEWGNENEETTEQMKCNAKTGDWDQRCQCEWNLHCEVPQKPNAQYQCKTVNGIFECTLQCAGKGSYVPARWPEIWTFRCKRGCWIEKEPQGCVYEPPCKKPTIENGTVKNCRKEKCLAPKAVWLEVMPGQANYSPDKGTGLPDGHVHIGYTGRKRRESEEEEGFTPAGKIFNDDGTYFEYTYNENGVPVTQAADDAEVEVIEVEENEPDEFASTTLNSRWSYNSFGRCPVGRGVTGGRMHCHTIGGVIGGGKVPIGMPPPMSGSCAQKNPITNGWMECKPNGGICMIMCNQGMVPYTRNLFSACNNRQWNPSLWGCRPGYCDPATYKEACWGQMHRRRRSEDGFIFENEADLEEQRGMFDRWIAPPPPPPPPPARFIECALNCHPGYEPIMHTAYKCDPRDGTFGPIVRGCKPIKKEKPTYPVVEVDCTCCDVKCDEWYRGGGSAKCVKGYWFEQDKCKKYGMCGKPANPPHGEYTCLYEHEYGYGNDRKRRAANLGEVDYDRRPDNEKDMEGWSGQGDYAKYAKNLNGERYDDDMVVDGYRWEEVKQKKMICNLACAPGYVAVKSQAVCIDGKWITKPSYCKPQAKCSAPPVSETGAWMCRVEKVPAGLAPISPGQCAEKNPIEGGWMECNMGGECMIMCNDGMKPLTTNLMTGCNGRDWNPKKWGCKPGYCNPSIYKEACWNPNYSGNMGRKRRSFDQAPPSVIMSPYVAVDEYFDINDFKILQDPQSMSLDDSADRWEEMEMTKMLVCKLACNPGTFVYGSEIAKCDLDTGFWHPSPGKCERFQTTTCMAPSTQNGDYKCYEVNSSGMGRKKRDADVTDAEAWEDVWMNVKAGTSLGRWGKSYMVCDLTCDPMHVPASGNYVAKCDQSNGQWMVAPTHCTQTDYQPKCSQMIVNGGYIECNPADPGQPSTMCYLKCADGFEPMDDDRTNFTCNNYSGGYTPQPIGCKSKMMPPTPAKCTKPQKIQNGKWKCYNQDYNKPYPKRTTRSEDWDKIPGEEFRKRRDADQEFFEEEYPVADSFVNDNEMLAARGSNKPQNYICVINCNEGYFLSGNYLAVCRVNQNNWILPPGGFCVKKPKKPKMCKKPKISNGSYECKDVNTARKRRNTERWGSSMAPLFHCTLSCDHGFRPAHGRWHATCDHNTAIWQIPPTKCIKDVRKCENVPSIHHGHLSCTTSRSEDFDVSTTTTTTTTTTVDPMLANGFTKPQAAAVTVAATTVAKTEAEKLAEIAKPAAEATNLIGAGGACSVYPAENEIKGGHLSCRKDRHGNTMCMIKCNEGFRPWHNNLVIYCRDNVYYNLQNPTEVQKNMKCKEAPCDVERFGVACYNHPANRQRRDTEFETVVRRSAEDDADALARKKKEAASKKTCDVQCNSGYRQTGSPIAECNMNSGNWVIQPGQCERIPDNPLGCTSPNAVAFGNWHCWVTSDSDDMRGIKASAPEAESEPAKEAKKQKDKKKKKAKDRGLEEWIPGPALTKEEQEEEVLRSLGWDRKRRDADDTQVSAIARQWNDALGRWGTTYYVCALVCDAGYEHKDASFDRVGCRMSDNTWLKPYMQKKHYCVPNGAGKTNGKPNKEVYKFPCDAKRPSTENGKFECDKDKSKMKCDLQCNSNAIREGSSKFVCKNDGNKAEVTQSAGSCLAVPELPSPPATCKPPSTWRKTGSYLEGNKSAACDQPDSKKCKTTYNLECKEGYVPFGPNKAICQQKKKGDDFWQVMPTMCVPQGFKAPSSWNVDNADTYFDRSEEWDYYEDLIDAEEATTTTAAPTTAAAPVEEDRFESFDDGADRGEGNKKKPSKKPSKKDEKPKDDATDDGSGVPVGHGQCVGLPLVPNYNMGKEKASNKKVGWECSNTDMYSDGTVCKPICGPGAMPSGINNVCVCDKKDRCKWKGYIKDHCVRMMCPPLPEPVNAIYIKTPKKVNKIAQRSGGELTTDGLIQTRWGSQFKKCPLGVEIPKSKVMCTLKCHDGLIIKGANKATEAKAACKCDEQGNCKWVMKSNECVAPSENKKKKKSKKN